MSADSTKKDEKDLHLYIYLIFGLNNYLLCPCLFLIHWTKVLTPYPVAPDG